MPVADIARTDVVTASRDTSVEKLGQLMRDEGVGSIIITEDGEPVGMVTDRDLSVRVLAQAEEIELANPFSLEDLRAEQVMSYGLFTADVNDSLFEVMREMCQESCRRVPVTDGDELYGILTLDDLLVILSGELSELAMLVADESPDLEKEAPELVVD